MGKWFDLRIAVLFFTGAAAFLAPLSWLYLYIPLAVSLLLGLFLWLREGSRGWRAGLFACPAAVFLAWTLISSAFSEWPAVSLFNWGMLPFLYAAIYLLTLSAADTGEKRKRLFGLLLVSAACVVVYGFFQFANIQGMSDEIASQDWVDPERFPLLYRRFYSTLENPNLCAGYLLMMISLCGPAGLLEEKKKRKWGLLFFTAVLVVCLLLTYSRGAWVSLAFMAAMLALLYDKRIWLAFLLVPPVLLMYHGQITARFLSLFSGEDTSTLLRFALWESTEAMIEDHPLLGVGWGTYYLAYPLYNFFIQDAGVTIYHAHNMYLSIAAEAGLPGLLLYGILFFGHGWIALKLYRGGQTAFSRALGLGTALSAAGMAVYGLGDYVLFGRALSFLFWFVCALCMGEYLENKS